MEKNFSVETAKLVQYFNRLAAQFRSPQYDSLTILISEANTALKLLSIVPQKQSRILFFPSTEKKSFLNQQIWSVTGCHSHMLSTKHDT